MDEVSLSIWNGPCVALGERMQAEGKRADRDERSKWHRVG